MELVWLQQNTLMRAFILIYAWIDQGFLERNWGAMIFVCAAVGKNIKNAAELQRNILSVLKLGENLALFG